MSQPIRSALLNYLNQSELSIDYFRTIRSISYPQMFWPNIDHDISGIQIIKIIPDQGPLSVSVVNHMLLHQLQGWLTVNSLQHWQQFSVSNVKKLCDGLVENLIHRNIVSKLVMEDHQDDVRRYSGSKSS